MNRFTAEQCQQDLGLGYTRRLDLEQVPVEHNQVRELADFDRSCFVIVLVEKCRIDRERRNR